MKRILILSLLGAGSASAGCVPQASWIDVIRAEEARYGMPGNLLYSLIKKESQFCPYARSYRGAVGLAQFMPGTARLLGINPYDPVQSIRGAARYLNQHYRTFNSWALALAAYNAGPGNVIKHKGIPPFRETRNYVAVILSTTGPQVAVARNTSAPVINTRATPTLSAPVAPPPVAADGPWNTTDDTTSGEIASTSTP